jgi:ferredoxin-thioredoxin reductase catalytic subunit/rhodanese-related sulfurtransferase
MIAKIDMESEEFKVELEKTKKFTNKVCDTFGWVYNPNEDVNEGVTMGLARNKIIYNKRYCPCFMVVGETKEERKTSNNRICPCKPAIEKEIPEDGACHCGIFVTPDYAKQHEETENAIQVAHSHSRGLTKDECIALLNKEQLDTDEIQALLEARTLDMVDFSLVDVREWMEWNQKRIVGTDFLVPTTSFYQSIEQIERNKEMPIIVYCLTGSRSSYCQNVLKDMGWKQVSNYSQGIIAYNGDTTSGE